MKPLAELYLPRESHAFFAPTASAAETAAGSDWIVAWSLGAWRMLDYASRGELCSGRVLLLAPFAAFCAEDGVGGKIPRAQVKWLRRWVQRDPAAALLDFRHRAGLGSATPPSALAPESARSGPLPYPVADLLEGLDSLAEPAFPALLKFIARALPARWQAVVGGADPLLDGAAVCRAIPGCLLVPEATHEPAALLAAAKDRLDAF